MQRSVFYKLFAMMFLEFFIWGAWLPLIFGYLPALKFDPFQQSLILNAFPAAAILAMFFSNQFADRYFAAEKFLAVSHLIGGLSIMGLAWVTDFWTFFILMLIHCVFYVPTISITNSIAFASMKDAQKEFGIVRMGGTIGWIAAAWPPVFILVDWKMVAEKGAQAAEKGATGLTVWLDAVFSSALTDKAMQDATALTYIVAGIASLTLAALSLSLPHTPPKPPVEGEDNAAWLKSLKLLAHPYVLVLWIVTFVDSFVHNCYFNWTGRFLPTVGIPGNWVTPVMSIGQIAEILTMAVLGTCLKHLGWRTTMIVGVLGHAARFAVFAFCGMPQYAWLIVTVNVLHGVCYAFFFATVYIFVDEFFPKDVRTSAQGLFNLMILGLGALVANFVCPWLLEAVYTTTDATTKVKTVDFRGLFLVPCAAAVVAAVVMALFFHPPKAIAAITPEEEEDKWKTQTV
jgi:nucleoside transporter